MKKEIDGYFDESVAATYDDDIESNSADKINLIVEFLAQLAGPEPVLEFAIGTGRIALPLSARGISVHGIEMSKPMVTRLCDESIG